MSKRKSFPVTEDEYNQIQRMKAIKIENVQNERKGTIELNKRRIKHNERAIQHKKDQIKNNTSLEKEESYLDNKKPFFMLQNEIEILEIQNIQFNDSIKNLQEEYEKTKK